MKSIPRAELSDLYFTKGLSHRKIAFRLGMSEPTVRKCFRYHGFIARERGSWMIKYPKTAFDGDEQEKAYILGFRVGDLNVYRRSKTSQLIIVRTNTTDVYQIELMQRLFNRFGGVKISGRAKAKNVICFLNMSFSFLLVDKPYEVEEWIKLKSQNCWAFMAGYIDAEANFIINQGRARLKIDSYDYSILEWMHLWLTDNGYNSKLRLLYRRGEPNYQGGVWNKDLWRININQAASLDKFCQLVKPYIRHGKRLADVDKCLDNILLRKANGTI